MHLYGVPKAIFMAACSPPSAVQDSIGDIFNTFNGSMVSNQRNARAGRVTDATLNSTIPRKPVISNPRCPVESYISLAVTGGFPGIYDAGFPIITSQYSNPKSWNQGISLGI